MSEKKKPRTIELKGWVAVTNHGNGRILKDDRIFYATRPFRWGDDTKWVRATAVVTLTYPKTTKP